MKHKLERLQLKYIKRVLRLNNEQTLYCTAGAQEEITLDRRRSEGNNIRRKKKRGVYKEILKYKRGGLKREQWTRKAVGK